MDLQRSAEDCIKCLAQTVTAIANAVDNLQASSIFSRRNRYALIG